jgi:hypothetical protein
VSKPSSKSDQEHNGCAPCDPEIVDCLKCKADGVQAQADYNAKHLPDLTAARANYDKTRADYRDARHAVALDVQDLRQQVKQMIERIKCLIKQDHVVDCLDEAYDKVKDQLDECGGPRGCCVDDDCEFPVDLPSDEVDEVLARWITDYQRRVDAAKACYTDLVQEPGRLTARVAALKAEVAGIAKDLAGDPAKTDLKELYARARVARRHVREVWLGFEHTNEFVECLCLALTCWSKGSSAIAVLTGQQAVRLCREQARKARCDYLRENTAKEVLAVYDKICSHHHCGDNDDEGSRHRESDSEG